MFVGVEDLLLGGEDVVWVGRCGLGGDDIETEEIYISRW